jgi:chromosome segregation ATPase
LSAIDVIKRENKKNKSLREELKRKEETKNSNCEELEEMITKLKIQVEEDKIIEEALKERLEERDKTIGNLEVEIVTLRKDIQKKNMQNSSKVLDNIINSQRPNHEKSELGYN